MANLKEPTTEAMAFGTLIQQPVEAFVGGKESQINWDQLWAEFLATVGLPLDYSHGTYNLNVAQRCLELYKKSPVDGETLAVEKKLYAVYERPDKTKVNYVSKPDFLVSEPIYATYADTEGHKEQILIDQQLWTVDIKFTGAYDIKPLQPDDDQMLGQAVTHGAKGFYRVTFHKNAKMKDVSGPIIERHLVDEALKQEWLDSTLDTILDIEMDWQREKWNKNTGSCWAYGRLCDGRSDCKAGGLNANS